VQRALLVLSLTACSWYAKGSPKRRVRAAPIECTDSYVRPIADTVGVAASATVGAMIVRDGECGALDCFAGPMFIALAPIMAFTALDGYAKVHACRAKQHEIRIEMIAERAAEERATARAAAWRITKHAAGAARAGNCDDVRASDRRVRELDAEFHATVFVRDVGIARCLAP
jgi:hypothetical protein